MNKTIKFFHKDKHGTNYAVQAELEKRRDVIIIKVFDFDREVVYIGYYDTDGGYTQGDALGMPEEKVEQKILKTVLNKLGENND